MSAITNSPVKGKPMEALSPGHVVVIAVVALIVFFGWNQLPDMSRSLGRSLRIFKTEVQGLTADNELRTAVRDAVVDARTEFADAAAAVRRPTDGQAPSHVA
jgi:sec-independent protein translocase protein TatA